jgi:hypothetical protein
VRRAVGRRGPTGGARVGTPSVPYGLFWLSPFEGTYATPPSNIVESLPAPIRAGEGGEERARERENEKRARYELS